VAGVAGAVDGLEQLAEEDFRCCSGANTHVCRHSTSFYAAQQDHHLHHHLPRSMLPINAAACAVTVLLLLPKLWGGSFPSPLLGHAVSNTVMGVTEASCCRPRASRMNEGNLVQPEVNAGPPPLSPVRLGLLQLAK